MSEIYLILISILILIGYSLGKARHSLASRIYWKSPNLNHFEIKQSKNATLNFHFAFSPIGSRQELPGEWRVKKRKNPTLSRLARKYLCVPGTSIQAERVFSWMECLLNKRRLSMSEHATVPPGVVNSWIFFKLTLVSVSCSTIKTKKRL